MPYRAPFLRSDRADDRPAARLERVLAVGRAFLTVAGLIAIYLDPTEPTRLAELTYSLLLAYAIYSLIVLALVHSAWRLTRRQIQLLHALDVVWVCILTFVSEGPMSPFFLFFLFVVLAAAYRWGFRQTVLTALLTVGIFMLETAVAIGAEGLLRPWFGTIDVELNRMILRATYLLIVGFLLGYLGEQEKQSRAEIAAIADAARQPRVDLGLDSAVTAVAARLRRTFDAASLVLVVQEPETGQTFLWRVDRPLDSSEPAISPRLELNPQQQAAWFFEDHGRSWHAARADDGDFFTLGVSEPGAWPLRRLRSRLPSGPADLRAFATTTCANMALLDQWRARFYLFDVLPMDDPERSVHFLEALTDYIAPGLTNIFLLRRLGSRASAAERARVARELHDGTIQALCGIGMKIEAVRRDAAVTGTDIGRDLEEVQELLHGEVLALRELMQALRPIELDASEQLGDVLASVVERFRRDTGISARFASTGGPFLLRTSVALEVVRIVQESLVNVRKHSRARNVLVRFTRADGHYMLVVEDDGDGFGFEGRRSADDLDKQRVGPAIIKERARVLGGQLAVESSRGVGARIELTFSERPRD